MAQTKIRTIFFFVEHMEEDDPTPHALPRWVELEYKVSERALSHLECHDNVHNIHAYIL